MLVTTSTVRMYKHTVSLFNSHTSLKSQVLLCVNFLTLQLINTIPLATSVGGLGLGLGLGELSNDVMYYKHP